MDPKFCSEEKEREKGRKRCEKEELIHNKKRNWVYYTW